MILSLIMFTILLLQNNKRKNGKIAKATNFTGWRTLHLLLFVCLDYCGLSVVCFFLCLFVCLFVFFVCLFVCFFCLFVCLSVCLSVCKLSIISASTW